MAVAGRGGGGEGPGDRRAAAGARRSQPVDLRAWPCAQVERCSLPANRDTHNITHKPPVQCAFPLRRVCTETPAVTRLKTAACRALRPSAAAAVLRGDAVRTTPSEGTTPECLVLPSSVRSVCCCFRVLLAFSPSASVPGISPYRRWTHTVRVFNIKIQRCSGFGCFIVAA